MIASSAAAWSHPSYERVIGLLGEETGLAFPDSRVPDAEAGVRRALVRSGAASVAEYFDWLVRGEANLEDLIAELTVGETYFFRDPLQFQVLREEILPALARQRPPDHVLRIWSAGCASGEEAYSLAITLEQLGLGQRGLVLATDLSRAALARARARTYGSWSLRGVDGAVIERWFRPAGERLKVDDALVGAVHFDELNLASDSYPSFANGTWRMDVILCRNVLIYLRPEVGRRVMRRLADCLAPGGWLLTAPSDPAINEGLESVVTRAGVVYRRPGAEARPEVPAVEMGGPAEPREPEPKSAVEAEPSSGSGSGSGSEGADEAVAPSPVGALGRARIAFARGDYAGAVELVDQVAEPAAEALCIRALANGGDAVGAEARAAAATGRYPAVDELHLLHAVLLIDLHRHEEAARAARRALYLDRTLTMGHFLLGAALVRTGDTGGALKAFRNARDLCAREDPESPVRFADGQRAGRLAAAAGAELERLAREVAP